MGFYIAIAAATLFICLFVRHESERVMKFVITMKFNGISLEELGEVYPSWKKTAALIGGRERKKSS